MNSTVTRNERDNVTTNPWADRNRALELVFLDGQLPDEEAATQGIRQQTRSALERVSNVAAEAGVDVHDLMRTTVYLTDVTQSAAATRAYDDFFDGQRPSRTVVGVSGLPNDTAIQIEAIGVK